MKRRRGKGKKGIWEILGRKKFWVMVALIMILVSAIAEDTRAQYAATWDVMQVVPGTSSFDQYGSWTQVGRVGLQTYQYYAAAAYCGITLAAGAAATAVVPLLIAGAAAGAAVLITYGTIKGLQYITGTGYAKQIPYQPTGLAQNVPPLGTTTGAHWVEGPFPDAATAQAAASTCCKSGSTGSAASWGSYTYSGWMMYSCGGAGGLCGSDGNASTYCYVYPSNPAWVIPGQTQWSVPPAGITTYLANDVTSTDAPTKAAAQGVVTAVADAMAPGYNDWRKGFPAPPAAIPATPGAMPAPPPSATGAAPGITTPKLNDYRTGLRAGVPSATVTNVTNADTAANGSNVAAAPNVTVNQGNVTVNVPAPIVNVNTPDITEEVHAGVDEALSDNSTGQGDLTPPTGEQPPTPPTKKSITDVLTWFVGGLASLPIISWITNQLPSLGGGNSQVCFPGVHLGGSTPDGAPYCVDFAQYESILDMLGNAIYSLSGLMWIMYLFKSGD